MIKGSQIIYNNLIKNKVKDVFLYSGGAIMPLIDEFYFPRENKINYFIMNHEQGLSHAATAYGKYTGKPGISIVTSGPGVTNSISGLLDATNDSTPFILISGQVNQNAIGTNAFQECPAVEITRPITKWSYQISSIEEIDNVFDEAFYISQNKKKGGVHLDIPKNILTSFLIKKNNDFNQQKRCFHSKKMSNLINTSKKPVIICGQGSLHCSKEIKQLVETSNIPITTTIHALGVYNEFKPLSLKFLGMHGSGYANLAVQNADLIINLGSRLDDRIIGNSENFAPNADIINVNLCKKEFNKTVFSKYNIEEDCKFFLKKILPEIEINNRTKWNRKINIWKIQYPFYFTPGKKLKAQQVLQKLNYFLKNLENFIITSDVGNHQMYICQFIQFKKPKHFFSSGSLGCMGTSLPYSIGIQIANREKKIICIAGDGGFNMSAMELSTIKKYNLPIKILLINNNSLDMVRSWEDIFFEGRKVATCLKDTNPSYENLAKSFDIKYLHCNVSHELDKNLDIFLNYKKSILLECNVEKDLCLPLVAPGQSLDQIIYRKEDLLNLNNTNNIPS